MEDFDFDQLTHADLVDYSQLADAFKNYLMDVLQYDEEEAEFVVEADFEDPYDTPFIMQEYECDVTLDGKEYEVRACYTDFRACGLYHLDDLRPFEFYMLFDKETMSDETVVAYQRAQKKYIFKQTESIENGRSFLEKKEKCTSCGALVDRLTTVDEGVFVCEECLDRDYVYCDECKEYYEDWVMEFVFLEDGRTLCEYCAKDTDVSLDE